MQKMDSPYLLKYYNGAETSNNYYLFTEYCNGGDLIELLNSRGKIKERDAQKMLMQLVQAFKVFFQNNIIHRDIKLENIMLHFPENDLFKMTKQEKRDFL